MKKLIDEMQKQNNQMRENVETLGEIQHNLEEAKERISSFKETLTKLV